MIRELKRLFKKLRRSKDTAFQHTEAMGEDQSPLVVQYTNNYPGSNSATTSVMPMIDAPQLR